MVIGIGIVGFVAATVAASINGDHRPLILESRYVPNPAAVRYGWSGFPEGNVVGVEHLPLAPFRSDDWPLGADRPYPAEARKQWNEAQRKERQRAEEQASADRIARIAKDLETTERKLIRSAENDAERRARKARVDALRKELAALSRLLAPSSGKNR